MKLWSKLAALVVLACFTTVSAQQAVCTDVVQQAITTVDAACAPTGRNQACYGNISILAMPREGAQGFLFDQQGDLAGIADLASMQLQQLDLIQNVWGIAVMKVQANLPDTLPGQNVTFLLFGDVRIDNAANGTSGPSVNVTAGESGNVRTGPGPQFRVAGSIAKGQSAPATGRNADGSWVLIQIPESNAVGWVYAAYMSADGDLRSLPAVEGGEQEVSFKPMQAFYFSTGIGQSGCAAAPDGILIQTPKGAGQISLRANDVDVQLGSTAYLQAQAFGSMTVSVLEGQGKVTAQGRSVTVPAGTQVEIPMSNDLKASGAPGNAQPYNAGALALLPIVLLPEQITIAPPLTVPVYPTWTRAPRQPTALPANAAATATEAPTVTPTFEASPTDMVGEDTIYSGEDTNFGHGGEGEGPPVEGEDTTYYGEDTTYYGQDTTYYGEDTTYYGNDSPPPTEEIITY